MSWTAFAVAAIAMASQGALTLDEALKQARAANAQLPVARTGINIDAERLRSARGQLRPALSIVSDVMVSPPTFGYSGAVGQEERLQLVGRMPLYSGGALQAGVDAARAELDTAKVLYRIAEKDLDLEVRTRFDQTQRAVDELQLRSAGLERLRLYLAFVEARHAAGEGVEADLLKARAQLADEEANLQATRRMLDISEQELADRLGRDPRTPLAVAGAPDPTPPAAPDGQAWSSAPDLEVARLQSAVAEQEINVALAGRRPRVDLQADTGVLGPGLVRTNAADFSERLRSDLGASASLLVTLPLLDFGIYQGAVGAARARLSQARAQEVVAARNARLQLQHASTELELRWREWVIRRRAEPLARDAYLAAESLYRGGAGTALAVLDAYAALVAEQEKLADAALGYRLAQAAVERWGTP